MRITAGKLCRSCQNGKCEAPPTPIFHERLDGVACDKCGGVGCQDCDGMGAALLKQCPLLEIPADVWSAMRLANYAKHLHQWPMGGGTLNETRQCLNIFDLIWSEQAKLTEK